MNKIKDFFKKIYFSKKFLPTLYFITIILNILCFSFRVVNNTGYYTCSILATIIFSYLFVDSIVEDD